MRSFKWNFALAAVVVLTACAYSLPPPDASFDRDSKDPKALLVLVGGNSECRGDGAVWLNRITFAADIRALLGLTPEQLTTRYFSWTGELPGHGVFRCLPESPEYFFGQTTIREALEKDSESLLKNKNLPLIIIGHSNGGATAALLSAEIFEKDHRQVDLLVTFDPVSRLSRLPFQKPPTSHATSWINVYTNSRLNPDDRTSGDWIALGGGAWNRFSMPKTDVMECYSGNHSDVLQMWNAVVLQSAFMNNWARRTANAIATQSNTVLASFPRNPCENEPFNLFG